MQCYKNPRQTNEQTDVCANVHRRVMDDLQSKLTKQLIDQCVSICSQSRCPSPLNLQAILTIDPHLWLQKWLEKCTDTCKDEKDMPCINACGEKYMRTLRSDFDSTLHRHAKAQNI